MVHSTTYWRVRCIQDSSDEENTPPNVEQGGGQAEVRAVKAAFVASGSKDRRRAKNTTSVESDSSTGTATPPWVAPQHGVRLPKAVTNPAPPEAATDTASSTPPPTRNPLSPTTSSPILLETPQSPPPPRPRPRPQLRERRSARQERRAAVGPYACRRRQLQPPSSPMVNPSGLMRTSPPPATRAEPRAARPRDRFVPAQWSFRVAHLRGQFNPLGMIFPAVPHFGWCACTSPCRVGTCRNSLMQLYCNKNCCPYEGMCGNGLSESTKVRLARNARTRQLSVVATDDIESGEVLGQYLGELEHVSVSPENRPRNEGYRLVMRQRPKTPSHPICVAINARRLGGLMRFVNHSCESVATFCEVANGRRTTVVVVTTEDVLQGQEITVDYGDDLWFICRCGSESCRHRATRSECRGDVASDEGRCVA